MRGSVVTILFGAFVALLALAPVAAAQPATGTVTIVHGLRGLTADVALDGQTVLTDFAPERLTDPLPLTAGPHEVEVRESADPDGPPVIAAALDVPAGVNLSVVVHPDAEGKPAFTAFANDVSSLTPGAARLVLRNTTAVPLTLRSSTGAPTDLEAATDVTSMTPAGPTALSVTEPGSGRELVAATDFDLAEGRATLVYAIGSNESGFGFLLQTIDGLAPPPAGVPTGDSGLATASTPPSLGAALLLLALAVALHLRSRG